MYSQVWSENYRMNIDHSHVFLESRMGTNLITSIHFFRSFSSVLVFPWAQCFAKNNKNINES